MSTLLLKGAEVLVTMDGARREIPGGGLYARDGVIEAVGGSRRAGGVHVVDDRDPVCVDELGHGPSLGAARSPAFL